MRILAKVRSLRVAFPEAMAVFSGVKKQGFIRQ